MKIAVFHELAFGGALRACYELGKRLKAKHQVDLFFVGDDTDQAWNNNAFNKSYSYNFLAKVWMGNDWKVRLYKDTIELYKLNKLHKKIAKDINDKRYDVVLVNPSRFTQAPFVLKFLSAPKVYFCQEPLRTIYDPGISSYIKKLAFAKKIYSMTVNQIRKRLDSINLKNADLLIANSLFSKKWIKDAYGVDAKVCYPGVDYDKFKPLKTEKKYDFLFFGRKDHAGGYDLLDKTIKLFTKKPVFKVLSKDPVKSWRITDQELIKEYNRSKVILMLGRNEPFTLIPLEAMACKVPVIAVNDGCLRESVINEKTGLLIQRSAKALYEAINKIVKNENLRLLMGNNARKNVLENWSWEKSAETLNEIIIKLA